jgi:hypothetical protein
VELCNALSRKEGLRPFYAHTSALASRHEIIDGDVAEIDSVDNKRHLLADYVVRPELVTVRSRVEVNLNLAVDHVDDPVVGDARSGVDVRLSTIVGQAQTS